MVRADGSEIVASYKLANGDEWRLRRLASGKLDIRRFERATPASALFWTRNGIELEPDVAAMMAAALSRLGAGLDG